MAAQPANSPALCRTNKRRSDSAEVKICLQQDDFDRCVVVCSNRRMSIRLSLSHVGRCQFLGVLLFLFEQSCAGERFCGLRATALVRWCLGWFVGTLLNIVCAPLCFTHAHVSSNTAASFQSHLQHFTRDATNVAYCRDCMVGLTSVCADLFVHVYLDPFCMRRRATYDYLRHALPS